MNKITISSLHSNSDRTQIEGIACGPFDFAFSSMLLQIGELGAAAKARSSIMYFYKPIGNAIQMKALLALWIRTPNNYFTCFILAQADCTAVGYLVPSLVAATFTTRRIYLWKNRQGMLNQMMQNAKSLLED